MNHVVKWAEYYGIDVVQFYRRHCRRRWIVVILDELLVAAAAFSLRLSPFLSHAFSVSLSPLLSPAYRRFYHFIILYAHASTAHTRTSFEQSH